MHQNLPRNRGKGLWCFFMIKVIYDQWGNTDFSDEGEGQREIENNVDLYLFTKHLTKRQRIVYDELLGGKTIKDIAQALKLSPKTIYYHRKNIRIKLRKFKGRQITN